MKTNCSDLRQLALSPEVKLYCRAAPTVSLVIQTGHQGHPDPYTKLRVKTPGFGSRKAVLKVIAEKFKKYTEELYLAKRAQLRSDKLKQTVNTT